MNNSKISVIIAVFNGADTLPSCINSVFSQIQDGIDLIVIDGGSTDGSVDVIKSYSNKIAYWESAADEGIAHAWNKGIKRAQGEWLYFLGADDVLQSPYVFQNVLKRLDASQALVFYGNVTYFNNEGHTVMESGGAWSPRVFRRYGMSFCHQAVFHHRSLFQEYGLFDMSLLYVADYELLLRYLKDSDAIYLSENYIARVGSDGLSSKDRLMLSVLLENMKSQSLNGLSNHGLLLSRRFAGALAKRLITIILGEKIARSLIDVIRPFVNRPRRY